MIPGFHDFAGKENSYMLYMNQLDYRHVPYMHNADNGCVPPERMNVASSGCGLCSLCMIVDHLTTNKLELEEAVRLSETNGANRKPGTSMTILGPIVAEKFGLEMTKSRDPDEMIAHLQQGGEIIVNVRTNGRPLALFTTGGHYMVIISTDGKEVCILDPSYTDDKFEIEGRKGKVRVAAPFIYCPIETLMGEIRDSGPAFFMFKRK